MEIWPVIKFKSLPDKIMPKPTVVWSLNLFQIILGQHQTGLDSLTLYKKLLFACSGSICSKLQWTRPTCICSLRGRCLTGAWGHLLVKHLSEIPSALVLDFNPFLENWREKQSGKKRMLYSSESKNIIFLFFLPFSWSI